LTDHSPSGKAIGDFVQVDGLVFQGTPEPLDEHIVEPAAAPVHADPDLVQNNNFKYQKVCLICIFIAQKKDFHDTYGFKRKHQ
jgi:hypothetical protein